MSLSTTISTRQSFPAFPPEIIDLFMENLTDLISKKYLLDCSLVSRTFRAAAQKRLFSTVSLGDYHCRLSTSHIRRRTGYEIFSRIKRFAGLLNSWTSNLGKIIRKLEIWIAPEFVPMISILKELIKVINSRAPNLHTLFICGLRWNEIEDDVAQSLKNLILRPSVIHLQIHDMIEVPRDIIVNCLSLRVLELNSNVVFASSSPNAGKATRSEICNYLQLPGKYSFTPGSPTYVSIAQLEHIEFVLSSRDHVRKFEKLARAASSLLSFDLLISSKPKVDNSIQLSDSIDLGSLHFLSHVRLRLGWGDGALGLAKSFILEMPRSLEFIQITFTTDIFWFRYPLYETRSTDIGHAFLRTRLPHLITAKLQLCLTNISSSPTPLKANEVQKIEEDFRKKIGCLPASSNNLNVLDPMIIVEMQFSDE